VAGAAMEHQPLEDVIPLFGSCGRRIAQSANAVMEKISDEW